MQPPEIPPIMQAAQVSVNPTAKALRVPGALFSYFWLRITPHRVKVAMTSARNILKATPVDLGAQLY